MSQSSLSSLSPLRRLQEAESELVYKSHEKKVKELEGWDLSPFRYMKLEKLRSGYLFKPNVTKMNCNECVTGRVNRQCKAKLCKPCCSTKPKNVQPMERRLTVPKGNKQDILLELIVSDCSLPTISY
jgi:hypothetical protein